MERMSIGEFARRSGFSPRAFRIYDELDLLRPARVDEDSGYRHYEPAARARTPDRGVAAAGLPAGGDQADRLARTRPAAAARIAERWDSFEVQHAARRGSR